MKRKSMLVLVTLVGLLSLPVVAEDVEGWEVRCSQDNVTQQWSCMATKFIGDPDRSSLMIKHLPNTGYCFVGSRNTHPGRDAVIRIGENDPIYYSNIIVCGPPAEKIIEQLKEETDGAARGTLWPSKKHEFEFNSSGFPAAFEALKAAVASKQK